MAISSNKNPIIELNDVKFHYRKGDSVLFDNLNLKIYEGEIVGVIGASGAGKTSLLYLMNGVIPQFYTPKFLEGEILFRGEKIGNDALGRISQHIGMVLDDPEAQLFNLYVKDELVWGPENLGLEKEIIENRRQEAVKTFKLQDIYNKTTHGLSGGQKQKLAIAAVSVLQPEVMMFDEPTSALDPAGTILVFDAIREMAKKHNMTIIMVEHKVEEMAEFADRMILVQDGKIVLDLRPDKFFAETELLNSSGILPPQITVLGQRLQKKGISITPPLYLSQAIPMFNQLIGNSNRNWKIGEETNISERKNIGNEFLVVKDLSYSYPDGTQALKSINLSLDKGEFVCIIGENGSGKTTLSKCIKRILKPQKNNVFINGRDVTSLKPRELASTVGYVFQNPDHQLFKDDVFSEIEFGLKNLKIHKNERKQIVRETLERFGLWEKRKSHPFRLSRGERQILALSAIYAMSPEILIADEPTTGLDRKSADELMKQLISINKEKNLNVVVITHWIQLAAEYGERIIALRDGEVLLDQDPRNAFSQTKELAKTNIMPPQISLLFSELKISPIPLTIKESEIAISSILKK
jgi:energy-coupling factor transport system ATP-binding protein